MKYLDNRDEFLKRSITKIDEYKSLENNELYKINEDVENSGPFANDIPWGDSLLGRLINSTIRKAKIGANLVRIKGVVRRLKYAFDDLLGGSLKSKLSEEDQKELNRIIVFSFIENLEKAVEEGARVGDIKNLTRSAISDIKAFEDIENKDNLIKQLEDFLKFLEQFKDDEGGKSEADEDKEEGEDSKGEKGEGEEGVAGKKTAETLYPVMVKNLKSLGLILANYKNVKIIGVNDKSNTTQVSADVKKYTTKEGDTVDKIIANVTINFKKLTADILRKKNQKVLTPFPKNDQPLKAGLVLVMETNMILEGVPGTNNQPGGSQDRGNIKGGEDHLTQAFTKLKKDIEVLISSKEKGIGVDTNFIKEITSKAVDTNTKNQIKALYTEINRYLVGDKKSTIQEKDPLYKESLEIISDKNKRIVVAEKMARFTKRALQFDKEGLYGGLGDLTKPLQDYVESIKQLMQMVPGEPKKEEVKKESLLYRYDSFIKLNEADDTEKTEGDKEGVGAPDVPTASQKIKDYWDKNIDVKSFVVEKTEVVKMKDKIEDIAEKNKKSIVINGIDPVLDIVKCFNRAYKLHTTQVIPSGRRGGRVSNKTFMEYTCFGSGSPENAGSGGGPYRNNVIFNQWENAVLDIMRDKKYQPIFDISTSMKVGNEDIPKAGANLRKFMTDMIDGDELYKTGKDAKGMQAQFLDKYFGYKENDPNKIADQTNFGGSDEAEKIRDVANEINTVKLKFTKDPIKYESYDNLAKTFFAAVGKNGSIYYFFIQEVVGDTAYMVYSRTFGFFDKYIKQSISSKMEAGDLGRQPNIELTQNAGTEEAGQYQLKAVKKKIDDLIDKDGKFKINGSGYEITYITKYESKKNSPDAKTALSEKPEIVFFTNCYTLFQLSRDVETKEGKTRFVLDKDLSTAINKNGGFRKVSASDNISKTNMKRQ